MTDLEEEDDLVPPAPSRVAARALVLSAVCCRAFIEGDAGNPGAEDLRRQIETWIEQPSLTEEAEPSDRLFIARPLGTLEQRERLNASWLCEGLAVLAWALQKAPLLPFHRECEPSDMANRCGFLEPLHMTPLSQPMVRSAEEIRYWADTYLTIHWRLRNYSLHHTTLDFVDFVEKCNWAQLRVDELEIIERELAIEGVRIDQVEPALFRRALSIANERHRAFNWLLGFEPLYSQVTADT